MRPTRNTQGLSFHGDLRAFVSVLPKVRGTPQAEADQRTSEILTKGIDSRT